MERLIRTIKEEWLWLQEFRSLEEVRPAIHHGITVEDNERDVHSSLGDKSPMACEAALSEQRVAQTAEDDSRSAP